MSSCCRTITTYRDTVRSLILGLRQPTPDTVVGAVDRLREVLGSHQIDARLAAHFRRTVEPALARVYSSTDLRHYSVQLQGFATEVDSALVRWGRKYCGYRQVH